MYCSIDDLEKFYTEKELIELSSETGGINTGVINECIETADSEIDTYLKKLYTVPLDPVPQIILKLSVDLTIYNLHERRNIIDESVQNRRKNAIELLKQISRKTANLGIQDEDNDKKFIFMQSKPRRFTRKDTSENMETWVD